MSIFNGGAKSVTCPLFSLLVPLTVSINRKYMEKIKNVETFKMAKNITSNK